MTWWFTQTRYTLSTSVCWCAAVTCGKSQRNQTPKQLIYSATENIEIWLSTTTNKLEDKYRIKYTSKHIRATALFVRNSQICFSLAKLPEQFVFNLKSLKFTWNLAQSVRWHCFYQTDLTVTTNQILLLFLPIRSHCCFCQSDCTVPLMSMPIRYHCCFYQWDLIVFTNQIQSYIQVYQMPCL